MGRLQTARLENFIRRWGSIKGPGSVLSETLGDVFPMLDLERLPPELLILAGKKLWGANSFATGGVAQLGAVQVENPAASGLLVVITSMFVRVAASQFVTFGSNANAVFGAGSNSRRGDTREPGAFLVDVNVRPSTNANTEFFGRIFILSATLHQVTLPDGIAVLAPGTNWSVVCEAQNERLDVSFSGYLRLAEPSELSF